MASKPVKVPRVVTITITATDSADTTSADVKIKIDFEPTLRKGEADTPSIALAGRMLELLARIAKDGA